MTLLWRSLLYVPAHVDKFVRSTHVAQADAAILDLQDSVPPEAKTEARDKAPAAARLIADQGVDVLVRINSEPDLAQQDLEAVVTPPVAALVLPHVSSPAQVRSLDRQVAQIETSRGMAPGGVRFVLLIESAEGLLRMGAIARASARVMAINIGNEDLALDLGVEPTEDNLRLPRQQMVIAAAAAGIAPLGLAGPSGGFQNLQAYRELALRARRMGHVGSTCIHPSQIPVLNSVFSPTPEEAAWSARVLGSAAEARAARRGAFSLDGKMIDAPIIARAERIQFRQELIKSKFRGENRSP